MKYTWILFLLLPMQLFAQNERRIRNSVGEFWFIDTTSGDTVEVHVMSDGHFLLNGATIQPVIFGLDTLTTTQRDALTARNGTGIYNSTDDEVQWYAGGGWVAVGSGAGAGGAPTTAQYVTLATNGTLTAERVLTGTANQVTVTDNGAGSTVVLSTPQNIHTSATPQFARLGLGTAADGTYLLYIGATTTPLIVEGATADAFEGIFAFPDFSSDITYTFPELTGTVAMTTNNLSVFAATTSAQLAGVLSDEAGTTGGFFRAGAFPDSFRQNFRWRPESGSPASGDTLLAMIAGVVTKIDVGDLPAGVETDPTVEDSLEASAYDSLAIDEQAGDNNGPNLVYSPTDSSLTAPVFDFQESATEAAIPGTNKLRLYSLDDNGFSQLFMRDASGKIKRLAQDAYRTVTNVNGTTITRGTAAYVFSGTGSKTNVKLARADASATMPAIGIVAEDIVDDGVGELITFGILDGIKTDYAGWNEGDRVYVDPATAGALTNVKPSRPDIPQIVGIVEFSDPTNGRIFIDVQFVTAEETDPTVEDSLETSAYDSLAIDEQAGDNNGANFIYSPTDSSLSISGSLGASSGDFEEGDIANVGNISIDGILPDATDVTAMSAGGNFIIGGGATASNLRLLEPSGSGTNFTQFVVQAQAGNITYTLPPDDGDAGEQLQTNGSGSLTWEAAGSGTGAFSDAGDPVVLNTTTKNVEIGDTGVTLDAKVQIGGDADEPQLVIEGHSTQTDDILIVQQDDETQVFTVSNAGIVVSNGFTVGADEQITLGGATIEYDDGVDDQVLFITDQVDATVTADPLFQFLVPAAPVADQRVFGIAKGTQATNTQLLWLDEDGDLAINGLFTISDFTNAQHTHAGAATGGQLGSSAIVADAILESHLKAVNASVDEDLLTFEATTGDFEWHTPGELGLEQETHASEHEPGGNDELSGLKSDQVDSLGIDGIVTNVTLPKFLSFVVDSIQGVRADTIWLDTGFYASIELDSIRVSVDASQSFATTFVEQNYAGGGIQTLGSVTTSTSGTNKNYGVNSALSHTTIERNHQIGVVKPSNATDRFTCAIFYSMP